LKARKGKGREREKNVKYRETRIKYRSKLEREKKAERIEKRKREGKEGKQKLEQREKESERKHREKTGKVLEEELFFSFSFIISSNSVLFRNTSVKTNVEYPRYTRRYQLIVLFQTSGDFKPLRCLVTLPRPPYEKFY
jgi:hypothetical protein